MGEHGGDMAQILLVDDDAMVRETIRHILVAEDHDVASAQDGREAVEQFAAGNFDLVVTDIIMPEKDGIEIIKEFRQLRPDIRILAISGGGRIGNTDFLRIAEKLGAYAIIAKPFDPDEFVEKVNFCLKRP
jgi:two-component system chemotaxis response regulator CheY